MKVLAIGATNSKASINQQLAAYTASLVEGASRGARSYRFRRCLFTVKTEKKSSAFINTRSAFLARLVRQMLWSSLCRVTAHTPQPLRMCLIGHHESTWKCTKANLLWCSPSPKRPGGASSVLSSAVNSAPYFDADVKGSMSVPSFYDNFNVETGEIINAEMAENLKSIMSQDSNRFQWVSLHWCADK